MQSASTTKHWKGFRLDEKIRGKLAGLADNLSSYQNTLNEIGNSLETDTRDFLSAINENDTFSFPV